MSKIILAILTVAAFAYACWLVFLRKPLPDPRQSTGLRRRFQLATLLFVGLMQVTGCAARPALMCYDVAPATQLSRNTVPGGLATVKAVWRTLDPKQSDEFRRKLEAAVGQGAIPQKTADLLAVAYKDLSFHREQTRTKGPHSTCYQMTTLGGTLSKSRETALRQLELLDSARASGTVDDQTADKARAVLARELEVFQQAQSLKPDYRQSDQDRLEQQRNEGKIVPSEPAQDAARLIVDMEREP
jgi:hypothetical protein